jgi:FixJ family two-component response regulator
MTMASPNAKAPAAGATVFIVDDDKSICLALDGLFRSIGLQVQMLPSGSDFLSRGRPMVPSCLVLDIRMPGLSGLELQAALPERQIHTPVIMMTGHGDIPMSVQAMKAGAVDFLTKPFRDQDMLDAVARAIAQDKKQREEEEAVAHLRKKYDSLTPRERDVMALVTKGLMNKQIAAEVGLSEITVKIYRGQVMKKMAARSVPDLVRMFEALKAYISDRSV